MNWSWAKLRLQNKKIFNFLTNFLVGVKISYYFYSMWGLQNWIMLPLGVKAWKGCLDSRIYLYHFSGECPLQVCPEEMISQVVTKKTWKKIKQSDVIEVTIICNVNSLSLTVCLFERIEILEEIIPIKCCT